MKRIFSSEEENEGGELEHFQLNQLNCPNMSTVQVRNGQHREYISANRYIFPLLTVPHLYSGHIWTIKLIQLKMF